MRCSKCGCKPSKCGCADKAYTTATIPDSCVTPPACSEYTNTSCILYNGPELPYLGIKPGQTLNEILQRVDIYAESGDDNICITSTGTPTCLSPILTVLSITATTIDIGWALQTTATGGYDIGWTNGITPGIASVGSTITHYQITGLISATKYTIRVDSDCGSPGSCQSAFIIVKTS